MVAQVQADYSLSALQNLQADAPYYQDHASYINIRDRAIRQAGESLGMQTGLAMESRVIDKILTAHSHQLDQIFDFRLLMYNNNVLPPVIISDRNSLQIGDQGDVLHIAGQTYRLIQQVRFVTAPPTWRDYLWMAYPYPQYPDHVLLPKNAHERAIWQKAVNVGWDEGIEQGITIFQVNLNRLNRDFNGMVLYQQLLVQNMVSPYYISQYNHGITGNGQHVTIDNRVLQITTKPALQFHATTWQPALIMKPGETSAERANEVSASEATLSRAFDSAAQGSDNLQSTPTGQPIVEVIPTQVASSSQADHPPATSATANEKPPKKSFWRWL